MFSSLWPHGLPNSLSFPVLHHLPKFAQTHVHWVSDAIQLSHPLWPFSPPALNLSQYQGPFQCINSFNRWPKYWSFSISSSSEYLRLISSRIDWFDLLAVQGTLKSLLQHHNPKALILQCSAFYMVQLSHPDMTTGKTTALTIRNFVDKLVSLLFNILSRFVIAILIRSKHLLIWNIIIELDLVDAWNRPSVTGEVRISELICPISWQRSEDITKITIERQRDEK